MATGLPRHGQSLAAVEQRSGPGVRLQLTLARARADSRSLLEEQERQITEERRRLSRSGSTTRRRPHRQADALQARVEQRLAGWAQDLDRIAEATKPDRRARAAPAAGADARSSSGSPPTPSGCGRERRAARRGCTAAHRAQPHARRCPRHRTQRARRARGGAPEGSPRARGADGAAGNASWPSRSQREEVDAMQRVRGGLRGRVTRQIEQLERAVDRAAASHADEAAQSSRSCQDLARGCREAPGPRARPRGEHLLAGSRDGARGALGARGRRRRAAARAQGLDVERRSWSDATTNSSPRRTCG